MKERLSNIELLRIIAIMMVVLVHSNYYSLGYVVRDNIINNPVSSFARIFLEQFCIIGVDIFVLISGWFGIKPTLKGGLSILFQVVFWGIVLIAIALLFDISFNLKSSLKVLWGGGYYWFIPAYLILYVLAPVLNCFIENSSPKSLLSVILLFFIAEFAYGWLTDFGGFNTGYSALSFIGLYLLARFVNLYSVKLKSLNISSDILLFLACTIIPSVLYFWGIKKIDYSFGAINYNSPFVISAALFVLLAFSRIRLKSRAINWMAKSALSIYIIHLHPVVSPIFKETMNNAYTQMSGIAYIGFAIAAACAISFCCILADQLRIISWKGICRAFLNKACDSFAEWYNTITTKLAT